MRYDETLLKKNLNTNINNEKKKVFLNKMKGTFNFDRMGWGVDRLCAPFAVDNLGAITPLLM